MEPNRDLTSCEILFTFWRGSVSFLLSAVLSLVGVQVLQEKVKLFRMDSELLTIPMAQQKTAQQKNKKLLRMGVNIKMKRVENLPEQGPRDRK